MFGLLLAFLVTSASACVEWEADADLEGPRVIAASLAGPRTLEVGVAEVHEIAFSEPIDPASLAGALAIVEWEEVGRCDLAPLCAEGSCERGRCQVDPL
ncbi:MAG: hypothetical protein KC420_13265, partial [Myxococcales bacterium]|nr:hypothetical protein [Myxococcales bacterium]